MTIQARIASAISRSTGEPAVFAGSRPAQGGSISDSQVVTLQDGRQVFIKTHTQAGNYPGMFRMEFAALQLLGNSGGVRVPRAIAVDDDFIVMEAFRTGSPAYDWPERIGRQLAQLHHSTQHGRYGFDGDNYLGTTKQDNAWSDNWLQFWREQRLGLQLRLFAGKATKDDLLLKLGERLMLKLDDLLADIDEAGVLLHGDLWSGNAAADETGEPIMYDPASYYGHREVEIGMMRMFGGFGPRCEAAYEEVWPFEYGAEERISLYRLYHELNHLNLFGSVYYDACISTMKRLL